MTVNLNTSTQLGIDTTGVGSKDGLSNVDRKGHKPVGMGRASGATTPNATPSAGTAKNTDFNFDHYLSDVLGNASISELSEEELQSLTSLLEDIHAGASEVLAAIAEQAAKEAGAASGTVSTGASASSLNIAYSKKAKDLLSILSQLINLDRTLTIQKIANHTLNIIAEQKASAQELRSSADKIKLGAGINFGLTLVFSGISAFGSWNAWTQAKTAQSALKPNTELKDGIDKASKGITTNNSKISGANSNELLGIKADTKDLVGKIKTAKAIIHDNNTAAEAATSNSKAASVLFESLTQLGRASGGFADSYNQAESKRLEADAQEKTADAQLEQGTRDNLLQTLNAIKTLVEALMNAFREIRDTQDQVKANIARNA